MRFNSSERALQPEYSCFHNYTRASFPADSIKAGKYGFLTPGFTGVWLRSNGRQAIQTSQRCKSIIEEMFSDDFDLTEVKFSKYIAGKLFKDYDIISSSFSSCQGITLEKYILNRRIEKVKELLVYSDQSINDIAFNLGYSSVAHLSKQFKAITGLNLSHFREIKKEKRVAAELAS
jgi:AraC-like DNA-binding protein